MDPTTQKLINRTQAFAIQVIEICEALSPGGTRGVIKQQLTRAATSVGANYRAAKRGRSRRDFIAKLGLVEEEADECIYWLQLLIATQPGSHPELQMALCEADELVAIMVASRKTAAANLKAADGTEQRPEGT